MLKTTLGVAGLIGIVVLGYGRPVQAATTRIERAALTSPQLAQTQSAAPDTIGLESLQRFARAFQQMWAIRQESQIQMQEAIEWQGLTPARYSEIVNAQQDPNVQLSRPIVEAELQDFRLAASEVASIEQESLAQMRDALLSENMGIEEFTQILIAVRQNPDLWEQVQELLDP